MSEVEPEKIVEIIPMKEKKPKIKLIIALIIVGIVVVGGILTYKLAYDKIMWVLSSKPDIAIAESIKVTIPEYFTFNQTLKRLSDKKLINIATFRKIANSGKFDYKFIKDIPSRENRLEGYLFPDTYFFDFDGGETKIIDKMLKRFNEIFKPAYYKRAKELNMTVDQIIILASIIEREAKVSSEKKIIASVFYNRLNSKDITMRKLQSCATVQYVLLDKYGKTKKTLTNKDTAIKSPYNTYIVDGLPVGPICSPGKESIEAALYPAKTDYYYFVIKGDDSNTSYFSKTYSEHLRAISKMNANVLANAAK